MNDEYFRNEFNNYILECLIYRIDALIIQHKICKKILHLL